MSWLTNTRTPTTPSTYWCASWSAATAMTVFPGELCVVGDADQSIYAFRGATIRNIEDFERDYPDTRTILLEQNYRSTQNILSAANSVIARNAGRREKRLWTDAGAGELIVGYVADNEHDEARFVAEEIDALAEGSEITYNDVAVFYRTNNSSRSLEEVLIRAGIPYKVVGECAFTSARRFATSLPTCACWTTRATRSAYGASLTPAPRYRGSCRGVCGGVRREHRRRLR